MGPKVGYPLAALRGGLIMHQVHLHGELARFGGPYKLHITTPSEAARALCAQMPELRRAVVAGHFRVFVERGPMGFDVGESELHWKMTDGLAVHIIPVLSGAGKGKGGPLKIIAGIALIALAIVTGGAAAAAAASAASASGGAAAGAAAAAAAGSGMGLTAFSIAGISVTYANIAMMGVSMALTGLSSMLTPSPKMQNYGGMEAADKRQSFLFNNNPGQQVEQGHCVPVVYGWARVGSIPVSQGVRAEEFAG
jgi:predicted phage tail protein